MSNKKRPNLKGKGVDFFLEEEKHVTSEVTQSKVTFYLPSILLDKLDKLWLDLRRKNRKLKKSEIARIALTEIIQDHEKKQQNSVLSQHLTNKTSQW